MIVLTGATGGIGSQVLKHLLQTCHVPPTEIILSIYNPNPSSSFISALPEGIQVRRGDFADPGSLDEAFKGADRLLLVSYPSVFYEPSIRAHINAIDAAKRVGVKHIYYTSVAVASEMGEERNISEMMRGHLDTERYLKESGITYTILKEGIYAESYSIYMGLFDHKKDTDIYITGDGPVAWASREELGEATARVIAKGSHPHETLLLSGPPSNVLTLSDISTRLSTLLSRKITLHTITVDEYVQRLFNPNSPRLGDEAFLREWVKTHEVMQRGEMGVASDVLGRILGREPKSMEACLRDSFKEDLIGQLSKR
ncbi:NAD-P-binding protein [Stereum hirsutum FP-91666 SS1]|uniref:NAD-P-binding protein n=1 Tax=Stereum hirsutum (strain FP-91666) TaxID=721885 RepID=UPI0004449F23|nr:NAD-P-binding protein [Stereum hirsutum FP-91666 SS1]EIM85368.1 NAD-P-binding protein [Stereum hirsutum FP-91666 SS1]